MSGRVPHCNVRGWPQGRPTFVVFPWLHINKTGRVAQNPIRSRSSWHFPHTDDGDISFRQLRVPELAWAIWGKLILFNGIFLQILTKEERGMRVQTSNSSKHLFKRLCCVWCITKTMYSWRQTEQEIEKRNTSENPRYLRPAKEQKTKKEKKKKKKATFLLHVELGDGLLGKLILNVFPNSSFDDDP